MPPAGPIQRNGGHCAELITIEPHLCWRCRTTIPSGARARSKNWLDFLSTSAFGKPIQDRRASVARTSTDGRVSRSAPEWCCRPNHLWRRADAKRSLLASPERRSASRRRNDAGAPTAQPTGFACCATRHVARPDPSVVHCQRAVRLSDWNAVAHQRARPTRHCS